MQITQSFSVGHPRERVWSLLKEPQAVVTCMPGAALTAPVEDGKLRGEIRIKLGPIAAGFAGEGDITYDDATYSGAIRGQGLDRKNNSRAKGEVTYSLRPAGTGTTVDVAVDFTLTGALAQFSRGAIVQDLATRLTAEFAKNLEERLAAVAPPAAAGASHAVPEPVPPQPKAAPALDAGGLLLAVLWDRIKLFFARLFEKRER